MTAGPLDIAAKFARLAQEDERESAAELGGVKVRLVRVEGGREGRWDSHAETVETALVWSGDFQVEFRDRTLRLGPGQYCVVPVGSEHHGSSTGGPRSSCSPARADGSLNPMVVAPV